MLRFAMPSNNNNNGHVQISLRKSSSNDSQDAEEIAVKVNQHHEQNGGETKMNPDTVDFGTTTKNGYHNNNNSQNHNHAIITTTATTMMMIDNRQLSYVPIRLVCGVVVYCSPEVLSTCPMVVQSLQADVTRALKVLPPSVHSLVQRTNIWVNASYSYGHQSDPQVLRHLTTHHQEGWLVECARDNPIKAGGIEVYNCWDFERMRLHWNGSGLLLHELCHLIHQHCVPDGGLDNQTINQLYETAKASGRYQQVLRRDWAGMNEDYDLAYAMVDKKEFFAEMSVAFLCHGYASLSTKDPNIMEECNPPLLHPTVTRRVMAQHGIQDNPLENVSNSHSSCWTFLRGIRRCKPKVRMVDPIFTEAAMSRCCINVDHCNKFYPFTRGQLQWYDPELFRGIRDVWREVSMWEDPQRLANHSCCGSP